jgi:hypothetical protein
VEECNPAKVVEQETQEDWNMHAIETHVHVGGDGMLRLEVPFPGSDVDVDVILVVTERNLLAESGCGPTSYGSCADLGLRAPEDLPLQPADWSL